MNSIEKSNEYRKLLIKHATSYETRFKKLLKELGITAYVFQKEWIEEGGFYISDFWFSDISLTIELDGQQHSEPLQKKRDQAKAKWLRNKGILTMRITNDKVKWMSTGDLKAILKRKGLKIAQKQGFK